MAEEPRSAADSAAFFDRSVQPFLKKHCFKCHSGKDAEAEIRLETYPAPAAVARDRQTWKNVLRVLRGREMPPKYSPQPAPAESDAIVGWIQETLDEAARAAGPDPGRVTMRRLNRIEYTNTIRDLLGVEFNAAGDFPADDVGYGFDNIGDVLALPPILMEKYLAAAETIAAEADIVDQLDPAPDTPLEAIKDVLRPLATRAYRRPVTDAELDRLMQLASAARGQGDSPRECLRLALQAILVSPHFLFRVELDEEESDKPHLITEHQLATRMSYFLWSSMPDEALFEQARQKTLRRNLDGQIRRMLADAKSRALVENFATQWLQVRNLDMVAPDAKRFATFDDALRRAMLVETEMFFAAVMREDRDVLELVDADYTFANEPLARHYGIENVRGEEFRRVSTAGTPRGGVITQAGVLTVTSNPTRTSPVKRGKWILENILGTPPPPPPPDVPALEENERAVLSGSLRQRMEQHRKNPQCAVCHRKMDAMGFAMENFDAVGAWRTRDGKFEIDPSGVLPDGQTIDGPQALKAMLRTTGKDEFLRCLTEKMLTYALGRGVEAYDKAAVDRITQAMSENENRFSILVLEIVNSEPFQRRRGKGGSP